MTDARLTVAELDNEAHIHDESLVMAAADLFASMMELHARALLAGDKAEAPEFDRSNTEHPSPYGMEPGE